MNFWRTITAACIIIIATAGERYGFDQSISGAGKIKLSGPVTPEQMAQCKILAKNKLKPSLLSWLEEEKNIKIDTTDLLANRLFETFIDSCIGRAKETSGFKENYWTFSYTMQPEAVDASLAPFNDRTELLAKNSWLRLQNAIQQKNYEEIYYQSVGVIAYATGYMGGFLTVPGDSSRILIEEGRAVLKNFLERLSISTTGQILEGKPGKTPVNPPSMMVTIDGQPFAGLGLTGYIPGGADVFTGVTDNTGIISFEGIVVPFVKTGVMMYVTPNLGRVINNKWRIGIRDFGIKTSKDLNQIFFFKVSKPTYTLLYEVASTDPTVPLPPDIASGASMKRFLTDSCCFVPASDPGQADLKIAIKSQVASAGSGEMETGMARMNGSITIQAPFLTPPQNESEPIDFEKKYDKVPDVPLGAFLWDSNLRLHALIRNILERL